MSLSKFIVIVRQDVFSLFRNTVVGKDYLVAGRVALVMLIESAICKTCKVVTSNAIVVEVTSLISGFSEAPF